MAGASDLWLAVDFDIHFDVAFTNANVAWLEAAEFVWNFDEFAGVHDVLTLAAVVADAAADKFWINAGITEDSSDEGVAAGADVDILFAIG